MSKTIRIHYYAALREQRGSENETLTTDAATAADLYHELQDRHGFHLRRDQLKVAINAEFGAWDAALQDGDTVVFVPPVAGG